MLNFPYPIGKLQIHRFHLEILQVPLLVADGGFEPQMSNIHQKQLKLCGISSRFPSTIFSECMKFGK